MSQELPLEPNAIKAIEHSSVHRIAAEQVIPELAMAIKELVENSLDAQATSIEVRLKDYGLDSIEVIDNGVGIAETDYPSVGLKHHTSKLSTFEDLTSVVTFGFRGEALSALCALSERVTVTTSTGAQGSMGTVLELNTDGTLMSSSKKTARQRGTTVCVQGLFYKFPVRRKNILKHPKQEYPRVLRLLHAYALVPCTKENGGVRLTVSNQLSGKNKTVNLTTQRSTSLRSAVSAIWGLNGLENLEDLNLAFTVQPEKALLRRQSADKASAAGAVIHVRGLVSKFSVGCGRNSNDRQFFFVNGRPCNPEKVQKAFTEVYKSFNATQYPFIVADFTVPTGSCDINVSPDKRTILLHSELNLIAALKIALAEAFDTSRSTFPLNTLQSQEPSTASAHEVHVDNTQDHLGNERDSEDDDNDELASHPPSRTSSIPPRIPRPTETSPVQSSSLSSSRRRPASPVADVSQPAEPTVLSLHSANAGPSRQLSHLGSSQPPRYAGRSPEHVERVISADTEQTRTREVQVVLDTSGAAWNMRRAPGAPPPTKRVRKEAGIAESSTSSTARLARGEMRERLKAFARAGSQVVIEAIATEEPEEDSSMEEDELDVMEGVLTQNERLSLDEPGVDKLTLAEDARMQDKRLSLSEPGVDELTPAENARAQDEQLPLNEPQTGKAMDVDEEPPTSNVEHPGNVRQTIDLTALDDDAPPNDHDSSIIPESSNAYSYNSAEVVRTVADDISAMSFDLDDVTRTWSAVRGGLHQRPVATPTGAKLQQEAGLENIDDAGVAEVLTRDLRKEDFLDMEVVGQFNKGFIVARQRGMEKDDLYIVDQHAADEKYNFETLQRTTKIESQSLLSPRWLELPAADELTATENMGVLRQNGFDVVLGDEEGATGRRIKLVALPVSKQTVFDQRDLEELLDLMRDSPTGTMVRCSKARAMFAMRACRKSIMVGQALTKKQMVTVVRHMATMDQPWHCPHGRPTMRHLVDLFGSARSPPKVDWEAFSAKSLP